MPSPNHERRSDDERIDKILDLLNSLHTKMELSNQTIENEIKRDLKRHEYSLYDSTNGVVNVVPSINDRVKIHSKIIWGVGGAVIVLLVNALGKMILK